MLDLVLVAASILAAAAFVLAVTYLELRVLVALARKFPVIATSVATAAVIAGAFSVAPAHAARPAGALSVNVHDAPNDNNGGSWAWSTNGRTVRAAAPSVAYRELRAFGECYPEVQANGSTAGDCTRTLRLSGATVIDGPYGWAGRAGGNVPVVKGKGVIQVPQPDGDHYIKVVLEARDGSSYVYYVQLLRQI